MSPEKSPSFSLKKPDVVSFASGAIIVAAVFMSVNKCTADEKLATPEVTATKKTATENCPATSKESQEVITQIGQKSAHAALSTSPRSQEYRSLQQNIGVTVPNYETTIDFEARINGTTEISQQVKILNEAFRDYDISVRTAHDNEILWGRKLDSIPPEADSTERSRYATQSLSILYAIHRIPQKLIKEIGVEQIVLANHISYNQEHSWGLAFLDKNTILIDINHPSMLDLIGHEIGHFIDYTSCNTSYKDADPIIKKNMPKNTTDISEYKADFLYRSILRNEGFTRQHKAAQEIAL